VDFTPVDINYYTLKNLIYLYCSMYLLLLSYVSQVQIQGVVSFSFPVPPPSLSSPSPAMAPSILTATLFGCLSLVQCQDEPLGAVSSSKLQIHVSLSSPSSLCCRGCCVKSCCVDSVDLSASICCAWNIS
jgi:hypothetical protein